MRYRILRLSPREALVRGGQHFRQQAERIKTILSPGWPEDAAIFRALDLSRPGMAPVRRALRARDFDAARVALLEYYRHRQAPRFPIDPAIARRISDRLPGAREAALRRGEAVLEGRVRLLGLPAVELGPEIHWLRDPISGKDWPAEFWADIKYLNRQGMDPKWVWELNRHGLLLDLGRAFAFSGDRRFADGFAKLVRTWEEQNPPGLGINWSGSLEVAHRLIAWSLLVPLLMEGMEPETLFSLLRGLLVSARYVRAYLSTYSSPNTHLIGEAAGLFVVGALFPEFRQAARWRELGSRILTEEIRRQFRADGIHFEQAAHYDRYATDFYLLAILIADRTGAGLLERERPILGRMLSYLAAISRPDGTLPRLGDDDGGRVYFLGEEPVSDCRSSLALGAVLLNRGDLKARAGSIPEEALWLLGADGIRQWEQIPAEAPAEGSQAFKESGFYILRGPEESRVIMKCGPQGWGRSGHGHADALAIEWCHGGRPILVDPGTFTYNGSGTWRSYFRGTSAHSTLLVDGLGQAEETGTFAWRKRADGQIRRWVTSRSCDLIEASHPGYLRLANPLEHRRALFFAKGDYLVVCDLAIGSGEHALEQRFQLAPGRALLDSETGILHWQDGQGTEAAIIPVGSQEATLFEGSEKPIAGWFSPAYGVRAPAPMVSYSQRVSCPEAMTALLVPSLTKLPDRVERLSVGRAGIPVAPYEATGLRVAWRDRTDYLVISHSGSGAFSAGPLDMDGEMAFLQLDPDGKLLRAILINGRALSWSGIPFCQADLRLESLVIDYRSGNLEVEASGPADLKVCHMEMFPVQAGTHRMSVDSETECMWLSVGRD